MATAASQAGLFTRLWSSYLSSLRSRPLTTKMSTSAAMYIIGDSIAQFGIEGRKFDLDGSVELTKHERWDPLRTARLTFYGGFLFAPLAHHWLNRLERVKLKSKVTTLISRLSIDCLIWSPFVCAYFPTSLGVLEGKNVAQIKTKVSHSWAPTYQKAVMVFTPTQIFNLTLVPVQHRLFVLQSVGLCWNIFLSWQNNRMNHRLELLAAEAQVHELTQAQKEEEGRLIEAKAQFVKKEGGQEGVAGRMSWA